MEPVEQPEDEPDYWQLYCDLSDKLTAPDNDHRLRAMVREEVDKRLVGWAVLVGFTVAVALWGWTGALVGVGCGVAYIGFDGWRRERTPGADRHRIPLQAEDYVRLLITAEAHAAGESTWVLKEAEYEGDERKIHAFDTDRWNDAVKRFYLTTLEFERLSPRERKLRIRRAATAAKPALEQGSDLAEREGATLVLWAARALQKLQQA